MLRRRLFRQWSEQSCCGPERISDEVAIRGATATESRPRFSALIRFWTKTDNFSRPSAAIMQLLRSGWRIGLEDDSNRLAESCLCANRKSAFRRFEAVQSKACRCRTRRDESNTLWCSSLLLRAHAAAVRLFWSVHLFRTTVVTGHVSGMWRVACWPSASRLS